METILMVLWAAGGIAAHLLKAQQFTKRWGPGIYSDPGFYVMFFPAIIAGPFCLLFLAD